MGAVALFASYLAWRAARWLAGLAPGAGTARPARPGAGTLSELSGTVSDYAVYAGLAVGGYEAHWSGTWELAAAVVIATAGRGTAPAGGGDVGGRPGDPNSRSRLLGGFLAFSAGGRVAVIVSAAPIWGAHATLLILLEWGIIATAYVITGHGPERVAVGDAPGRFRPAGRAEAAGSPVRVGSSTRAQLPAPQEPSARTELSARAEFSARVDSPAPAGAPVAEDSPAGADASVIKNSVVRAVPAARRVFPDSPSQADQAGSPKSPGLAAPVAHADTPDPGNSRPGTDPPARAPGPGPVDSPIRLGSAGLSTS